MRYKPGTLCRASLYIKAALVLFRPRADRQKTTIYNSGPLQDSRLFSKKPRDLPSKAVLRCMGGDLSAVIASASRRPRTSMCLVKAGSRPVQIAAPAFQPTPVCHDSIPGHQVSYQRFWENRWIPDSLPTSPRPRRKPPLVEFTVIKVKRNLPSMSFYESHRRQPSITRFARLNKQRSGDLSLFRSAPKS